MSDIADLLNPSTVIAASGASQALTFQGPKETFYDITLTANCALAINATGARAGQSIVVVLRGAYTWTGPGSAFYANNAPPLPQCSASLIDIMQYSVLADGTLFGAPLALGAGRSSLAVSSFSGTVYAGGALAVAGTYAGLMPSNLDCSVDGGGFTTLSAGAATITNGAFSFSITAPAAGAHTIQVRATGTGEVSPAQNFTIAAAAAPAAPTLSVSPGNTQNTINWTDGSANGSAITSHKLYRGTASGGEALVGTINTGSPYVDGSLTNGTTYYYKLSAVNGVGEGAQSAEASGAPTSSFTAPAHYLASDATHYASAAPSSGVQTVADGYLDVIVWVALSSYAGANNLFSKWAASSNAAANSSYTFFFDGSGKLNFAAFGSSFFNAISTVTLASAVTPDATKGIFLRAQINAGSSAVTPTGGPVSSIAAGTGVYSYANPTSANPDNNTWTQLGATIGGLGAGGISQQTTTGLNIGTNGGGGTTAIGKFFAALARNSAGAVLTNPDFGSLATGAPTITDTAPSPVTYALSAGGIV